MQRISGMIKASCPPTSWSPARSCRTWGPCEAPVVQWQQLGPSYHDGRSSKSTNGNLAHSRRAGLKYSFEAASKRGASKEKGEVYVYREYCIVVIVIPSGVFFWAGWELRPRSGDAHSWHLIPFWRDLIFLEIYLSTYHVKLH